MAWSLCSEMSSECQGVQETNHNDLRDPVTTNWNYACKCLAVAMCSALPTRNWRDEQGPRFAISILSYCTKYFV